MPRLPTPPRPSPSNILTRLIDDACHNPVIPRQVLAMHLKKEKRVKEAVAVMKRLRAMEEELAGVPQEEEGEEGEGA